MRHAWLTLTRSELVVGIPPVSWTGGVNEAANNQRSARGGSVVIPYDYDPQKNAPLNAEMRAAVDELMVSPD